MHRPTDRIPDITAFVTPVVEHWLERQEEYAYSDYKGLLHHIGLYTPRTPTLSLSLSESVISGPENPLGGRDKLWSKVISVL